MRKSYLLLALLSVFFSFAQKEQEELNEIVNAEMKSASNLMAVAINPNTLNYDVTYHKLEFTIDPAEYFITGKVTTTYTALANMNAVTFDLATEMTVTSVKIGTTNLTFTQNTADELVFTLPNTQAVGTSATIEIQYSGAPPSGGFGSFAATTHNGTPVLWTLSEPFGARDWWPCKQDLNDKINSIDVFITAPSQYIAVANGVEQSQTVNGTNKTTHFQHNYPIPAYLICIAATNYTVYTQTSGTGPNTFPIVNYIYPENFTPAVQTQLNQTPLIMDFFNTTFELYPFHNEKYGHAQFGWGGGMEHTTVSFMNNFSRGLIAHELAHQWFGDKITCGTWKDIWLNEGFATYLASLVIENFDGNNAFIADKTAMINNITSQLGGAVYLTDTEASNVGRIFSSRLSYNKGAMVLNMLRLKMGDTMFFQALRNYLADTNLAFKYAVTSDLKSHLEAVYGSSLTEFFNDWVFGQGYPTYTITAQNWGSGQAKINVSQTQSHSSVSFFEMPIPVRLVGTNGQTFDTVLENTNNNQEFIISVPFAITNVIFDPEKDIISKNNSVTLGNENFSLEKAIVIYPNPVTDKINIQLPDTITLQKVTILNSLGQVTSENNTTEFPVNQLSEGIYFIQIQTSEGTFHKKIIKN
ncbi:M1 family aminopeptidase [Flavobacterium sp.]|uniref:M1 family aminopeptidase n=1 Tax=Flavobacterium sp. TaxID=239 RepID=UPI002620E7A1|nr:M1 family aminopeptidase [Flavobacterium sp.]